MSNIHTIQPTARPYRVPFDPELALRSRTFSEKITSSVNYLVPGGHKPSVPIGSSDVAHGRFLEQPVTVRSARPFAASLDLDTDGFALVRHDTKVKDFYDDDQIDAVYYPEAERLLKDATGAAKVLIFDYTRRVEKADTGTARGPVQRAHNDYTDLSGPQRVRDLLPEDEAKERLQKRFAIVNIWRPINHPVETTPLAIADARSVRKEDFIATDLVYPDRVGEIYHVAPNPDHDWLYVPRQTPEEALLLKVYDSALDGRARYTAHSAIRDPNAGPDAKPRESIELRALLFFDED